jgi:tetratricopeptide (TPR) repeat protein
MRRTSLALALLVAVPAMAATRLEQAEDLYRRGDLRAAASLARQAGGAEGLSLAAKATLVDAVWRASPETEPELLEQAAADAEAALKLDPNYVDAHLQLAIALGQLGDLQDPVSAHLMGYGHEGKLHLDRALELAPDDPWAHALLGIWHLQIVRRAGAELAEQLYGASEARGVALCHEALALAPDEPNLGFGCAVSMLEVDGETYRAAALALLESIKRRPPEDEAERLVRDEAAEVVERVKAGQPPNLP